MSALQRKSPMPRKRKAGKRRTASSCKVRGCTRRIATAELCKTHAIQRCDILARAICREKYDRCARCGSVEQLDWSHHFSRTHMHSRWHPANAVMHCRKCHAYLTYHPDEHTDWIRIFVGGWDEYDNLADIALGEWDESESFRDPKPFTTTDLAEWLLLLEATAPTEKGE